MALELNNDKGTYVASEWKDGTDDYTPITPARLNHMEQGIQANSEDIKTLGDSISQKILSFEREDYGKGFVILRCGLLRFGRFNNNYTEAPTWNLKEKDYPDMTTYGGQLTAQESSASVFPVVNADSNTVYFGMRNGSWSKGWIFGQIVWFAKTVV